MYTTKPLSLFKSHPEAAAEPPPEGGNAGYLVVKSARDDEDGEMSCFCCPTGRVLGLPFPQNRVLSVQHGKESEAFLFVPVPDQPLASNRYYIVVASGTNKGLVMTCAREEDVTTCCFCRCVPKVEPRLFDPADIYQQVEIVPHHQQGLFTARAVAADGFVPSILSWKYWSVYDRESKKKIILGEAPGLDAALRSCRLGGSPGQQRRPVGKWYCPFFLIKEHGVKRRDQMGRGAFYEVVLEQKWEPVHGDAVRHMDGNSMLASKKVLISGSIEAKSEAASSRLGAVYVWFVAATTGQRVGVCTTLWEMMLWEETKAGWVDQEVEAGSVADGSVMLFERFVVARMNGSVVVAFDFVHHNTTKAELV